MGFNSEFINSYIANNSPHKVIAAEDHLFPDKAIIQVGNLSAVLTQEDAIGIARILAGTFGFKVSSGDESKSSKTRKRLFVVLFYAMENGEKKYGASVQFAECMDSAIGATYVAIKSEKPKSLVDITICKQLDDESVAEAYSEIADIVSSNAEKDTSK